MNVVVILTILPIIHQLLKLKKQTFNFVINTATVLMKVVEMSALRSAALESQTH